MLFENDALDDAITMYCWYSLRDWLTLDDETVPVLRLGGTLFRGICEVRCACDGFSRALRLLRIVDDLCYHVRWEEASAR